MLKDKDFGEMGRVNWVGEVCGEPLGVVFVGMSKKMVPLLL